MSVFLQVEGAPVCCNVMWASRDEALSVPRARISLAYCDDCSMIYNVAFDPSLVEYSQSYENSLHFSPRFQEYAEALARQLVTQYALQEKNVVEIGCGQGEFLALLARLGNNRAVGFDPSYDKARAPEQSDAGITILRRAFSENCWDHPPEFLCCRHVLEHIASPVEFLRMIRQALGKGAETVVFFEVPNGLYTFENMGIWDIIYEHCSYFTQQSLARVFVRAGFVPLAIKECYGGQFLTIEARVADCGECQAPTHGRVRDAIAQRIRSFAAAYHAKVNKWQEELKRIHQEGRRVVVWGAGSKGISFLNTLTTARTVQYIVDMSPRKQGRYLTGSGQRIVDPGFLRHYRPQVVIGMNPIYQEEMRRQLTDMGISTRLVVA